MFCPKGIKKDVEDDTKNDDIFVMYSLLCHDVINVVSLGIMALQEKSLYGQSVLRIWEKD